MAKNACQIWTRRTQRDTIPNIPPSQIASGQTSGLLSFHITMYQVGGPSVVKLHFMSHQNYAVNLHCLEVLYHARLSCHKGWVIHPQERGFYFSALLRTYCKLLQILVLSQETNEPPPQLSFWLLSHICVSILGLLLMFTEGRYAV